MDESKLEAAVTNANAVSKRRSDEKEDGELSPSHDDEGNPPVGSVAQSSGVPAAAGSNAPLPPLPKSAQGVQTGSGKAVSDSNSYNCDILPQTSVQKNYQKGSEKIQVSSRSSKAGQYVPNFGRNSLVINFSDDDSGSDEDELKKRKLLGSKGDGAGVGKNHRLTATSSVKSNNSWKNTNNVNKVISNKPSLSHAPKPSVSKLHGANSRIIGPSPVDQKLQIRNFSMHNRSLSNQRREEEQNLRQQIAIRENELKRKSSQQNKAVPIRNIRASENDMAKKYRSISAEPRQMDTKGPEQKRLKVGNSYSIQKSSKGHQGFLSEKDSIASKEQELSDCFIVDENKSDHMQKVIPVSVNESRMVDEKKLDENQMIVLSENAVSRGGGGPDVDTSYSRPDANRVAHSCDILNESKLQKDLASNSMPKNTASVIGASFLNSFGTGSVPEQGMQSFVEMEEALDKELEEAQEHRYRCEIEERNSLRAYRSAQRALLEANVRCNRLYHKRELYASHYNSLLINNSKLPMSSRQQKNAGFWPGSFNSSENAFAKHTSRFYLQSEYDGFNQIGNNMNVQCANSAPCNIPGQNMDGDNMGSEHYSEPDATSELLPRKCNDASGVCSPSSDPITSADEDEGRCLIGRNSEQPTNKDKSKENNDEGLARKLSNISNSQRSLSSPQDSLKLEATLRSELFARLGSQALLRSVGSSNNLESAVELKPERHVRSGIKKMSNDYMACSDAEKDEQTKFGDTNELDKNLSEAPASVQHKPSSERRPLKFRFSADSEEPIVSSGEDRNLVDLILSPFVLRTAFDHVKCTASLSAIQLPSRNLKIDSRDSSKQTVSDNFCWNNWINKSSLRDFSGEAIGSYSCTNTVDPHWPLCIFGIRGKCNNKKCPWQHLKDNLSGRELQHFHETSKRADGHEGSTVLHEIKCSKQDAFGPFYFVGMDILKSDTNATDSVLERGNGEFWRKCFSIFLVLSPLFQKNFPADKSFMYGTDGRFEVPAGWSRQLLYLQNRNGSTNQLKQCPNNSIQALEKALLILNQGLDKLEDVKKALDVLSGAIDDDPTCVVLWIVYIFVYYSNKPFNGNDVFHHAVEHNQGSYELWLMYINSRERLDDRLAAYNAALSALCHCSSASKRVDMHTSACILDLFLQMIDCLCMSGNINKAIQKVSELHSSTTYTDKFQPLLLSDILACLTISDKCIFWFCCLYFIIYKKLPDCIVYQVEYEKELLEAEWPSVNLVDDEKNRVLKLAEMAADSIKSCIDNEPNHSCTRSAELFALNYMKCMVALNGLRNSRSLLGEYIRRYPNCLEFALISARMCNSESGEPSFTGFEEIISKWEEVPGIQCIWNQYAEYALRIGRNDFAKELMVRWFDSVWKVKCQQDEILETFDSTDPDNLQDLTMRSNGSIQISDHNRIDMMFGFLNLALHRLLQNDHSGARLALQRAVKAACREHYKHCIKELASFLNLEKAYSEKEFTTSWVLEITRNSLDYPRSFSDPESLSRKFINTIERPKVRQLVTSMLSPISADFSVANYILESLNGPTLIPEKFSRLGDMVDFVESIMGLLPSNYQLALSLCLLSSGTHVATAVNCTGLSYWASLLLVNSILHAIPLPPECVWAKAASILCGISGNDPICERFYARALSVYPFSMKLWTSFYIKSKAFGDASTILEAARCKGVVLETSQDR